MNQKKLENEKKSIDKYDKTKYNLYLSGQCRCSSMVEPQPSKLMTWVRFPLPAPNL